MTATFTPYPIEVTFPQLDGLADSATGIPYVHSFDSGLPGPHVMVNALTHGNEVCGAIVVTELLAHGLRPRRGRLTLSLANVEAYQRFDPQDPDRARFVDQDFNRIWHPAVLDDLQRDSSELRRARAMRPLVDTVDLLLDLHSMHEVSAPLALSGPLDKGIALARAVACPPDIVCDEGHPEGRRLRDYGDFGRADSPRNALLVECGQHWEAGVVAVARHSTARFLLHTGVIDAADLPEGWLPPQATRAEALRVIRVREPVVAHSMDFQFEGAYTGLEVFPEAGTRIATRDGQPVCTPFANCVLVMPSLRQLRPGVTVVRLGELQP